MQQLVAVARKDHHQTHKDPGKKRELAIFGEILASNLPAHELRMERLKDEAVSLIGAGIASAEWTLTLATFHILNDQKR